MGFNSTNIPQPNDQLSVSQGDINNNFNYDFNTLNKDHQYGVNRNSTNVGEGRHLSVSFVDNGPLPFPADNTNVFLYGHTNDLFFRNAAGLGPIQLTSQTAGAPIAANSGFSWLPGGMMLQWANVTITSGTITPWTKAFSNVLNGQVTISGTNLGYNVTMPLLQNNQWEARIFLNGVEQLGNFNIFAMAIGSA